MSKPINNSEFGLLRIRGRKLRDQRIDYAKREYELTLVAIARLEQDLTGKHSKPTTPLNRICGLNKLPRGIAPAAIAK